MKCFRILILFFIQAYFSTLNAQSVKDFNVRNFTNDNGLPQNSIKSIELDKDGYMWMGTESGLVRFDGKNFRIFNRLNLAFLSSDRISHVGIMPDGNMFFIDEHSLIYQKNPAGIQGPAGQKANNDVIINATGGLFHPARDLGIAGYNYVRSQYIEHWTNNILFFPAGNDHVGFISINKQMIAFVRKRSVAWIQSIMSNRHVLHCSGVLNNTLYFLDDAYRLYSLDSSGRQRAVPVKGLEPVNKKRRAMPSNYSLLQQNRQLYFLYDQKIYLLTPAKDETLLATMVMDAKGIDNISCFRHFPSTNLYALGTSANGLFLLRTKPFHTLQLPETDNIFYAQESYRDSGIITHLGIFQPHTFTRLPWCKINKLAILKDKTGGYWINRSSESIIHLDEDLRQLREIKLKDIYVNCFAQAPDSSIWFITNKNRIGHIGDSSITWINMKMEANSLVTLLPADRDHFWVAGNRSLFSLNIRNGVITHYNFFDNYDVRCLHLDRNKVLWIGTYGKGYFALAGRKLTRMPLDNKGNLNYVHTLLEDRDSNVWITTNNGLFRTRKSELESFIRQSRDPVFYQHYTKEQGFNTNEFNGGCSPAAIELADGRISLPSMNGLIQFYPDSLRDVFPDAHIFIDEIQLDGKTVSFTELTEFPPSFNRMEIMISSPYYGNPANQLIEYCLKGFDSKWYPVNGNIITYNRLPYGAYTLMLRKKAGFGSPDYIKESVSFSVIPFFYQRWYFKLIIGLLCIGLALLFFRIRYFILIKKRYKLEHKVQQRTRELVYNNRLKEKLTLLIAHDLQSPLHFLSILARHVYKAAQNHDISSVLEGSEEIKNTTAKIYSFVEEFNLWNISMNENYRLKKTSFPIQPLIDELREFFEEMLRLKNNRLEIIYFHELSTVTDRDVLKAILRNIIDNSNKYTYNGEIKITITKDEHNCLMISVKDTGDGMTEQQLEKIQYRIIQAPSIPGIEKDGRLGFQLIIDFTARLGARLSVDSVKYQGTTVTISGLACDQ